MLKRFQGKRTCCGIFVAVLCIFWIRHVNSTINLGENRSKAGKVVLPYEKLTTNQVIEKSNLSEKQAYLLHSFVSMVSDSYAQWHKAQMNLIKKDKTYARSVSLLIFQGEERNTGFGDRMRSIVHCYLAAVASNRLFLIDLNVPFPWSEILVHPYGYDFSHDPKLFQWVSTESIILNDTEDLSNVDRYVVAPRVILQRSYPRLFISRFLKIAKNNKDLEIAKQISRLGLERYRPLNEQIAPFILKTLFEPSSTLREELRKNIAFQSATYLSLHARLGLGLGELHGRFNVSQRNLTMKSAAFCLGRLAAQKGKQLGISRFFIASDTQEAKLFLRRGILKLIPDAIVEQSKVKAKHVARLSKKRKQDKAHFRNTFLDISMLSMGKSILFVKSGFADIAVWLGVFTDASKITMKHCEELMFKSHAESDILNLGD